MLVSFYTINERVNNFIVKAYKNKDLSKNQHTVNWSLLRPSLKIFFIIFCYLLTTVIIQNSGSNNKSLFNMFSIGLFLTLLFDLGKYHFECNREDFCFMISVFLHKNLPNKGLRENIIKESFKKQQNLKKQQRFVVAQAQYDLKKFCWRHFQIKSSKFIDFYYKRAFLDGSPCIGFILYSLNIPYKKLLGPDRLRLILLNSINMSELCPRIDLAFSKYHINQIEHLFTNYQGKAYFNQLVDELNENFKVMQIYASFHEMELVESKRKKMICPKLLKLNNQTIKNYHFQILITKEEYTQTSEAFSNCINSYANDFEYLILRVKFNNKDYACVSLINNQIEEIKGIKNREIKNKNLIKIIKSFL